MTHKFLRHRHVAPGCLAGAALLVVLCGFPQLAFSQGAGSAQWLAFNRAGAPNSNLQCFSPSDVNVSGGNLVLLTRAETATCSSIDLSRATYRYTSGFVAMRSFSFLYGTVDFRAKFGGGTNTGSWPTVWLADASCQASDPTGTDDHCNDQEIDIAEILDGDFAHVNQQIHVDHFTHNDGCTAPQTSNQFHVYQLVWTPGSLVFRIDGTTTCEISQLYVPHGAMYLKVSVFAGRHGGPVDDSSLPWTTLIDYVRIRQNNSVIFNDDFALGSTVLPCPPATVAPSLAALLKHALFSRIWRHRNAALASLSIAICLVAVFGIWLYRVRGSKITHPLRVGR
ncbi:MAG TPA: glycoside hydrolase family 16 protein [Acidobacteriaceae bacterium]|jgi:hypothetical protein|nr:glycoside hydrolase family 16 protein [Acidobacteriaceae bacterium]